MRGSESSSNLQLWNVGMETSRLGGALASEFYLFYKSPLKSISFPVRFIFQYSNTAVSPNESPCRDQQLNTVMPCFKRHQGQEALLKCRGMVYPTCGRHLLTS